MAPWKGYLTPFSPYGDWGLGSGPFGGSTALDSGDSEWGDTWGGALGSDLGWILAGNLGGIWGNGGFGSGPLSGDFGPMGYPSPGMGIPCDFGTCTGPWPEGWVEAPDQANVAIRIAPPEFSAWAPFLMSFSVVWPFLPEPGENPLYDAGVMASTVASPWAPVAWYGTSTAVAVGAPLLHAVATSSWSWAYLNPIAWRCAVGFGFNVLGPPSPWVETDQYECGTAGQMVSQGIWWIFHPSGR